MSKTPAVKKHPLETSVERGKRQLQEVYLHLDGIGMAAEQRIAWYGQCRAREETHAEALEHTITHFRLRDREWYRLRMADKEKRDA